VRWRRALAERDARILLPVVRIAIVIAFFCVPSGARCLHMPALPMLALASAPYLAEAELGLFAWKEQNLLMADRRARDFGFSEPWPVQFVAARRWQDEAPARRRIFILENAMGDCVDKSRAIDVGRANRREWEVFGADAAIPGCVPKATGDVEGD
jgi:hypothetical protein